MLSLFLLLFIIFVFFSLALSPLAIGIIASSGVALIGVLFTACLVIALVACFWRRRSTRNYRRLQQPVSHSSTVAVNCGDTSLDVNQVSHHFLLFYINL